MTHSIELQVISKILTSESESEVETLCSYDASYYGPYKNHIQFILDHRREYGQVPDVFTFQAQFPEINLLIVKEGIIYLTRGLQQNKRHLLLIDTFNTIKQFGSDDVEAAWEYLDRQCEKAAELDESQPMDQCQLVY